MVSNRTLALLVVATVIVSLGGTIISLNRLDSLAGLPQPSEVTGFASSSGDVNLSITGAAACAVDYNVDFGTATQPSVTTTLSTDTDNTGESFNNCTDAAPTGACKGLQINNTGSENLNVSFNSSVNASDFLQDIVPNTYFQYYITNGTYENTSQGCVDFTGVTTGGPVTGTDNETICQNLTFSTGADIITLEFNVTVPDDVPSGDKGSTITVYCEQV